MEHTREQLREQLAAIQHGIWSSWMEYLFNQCNFNKDGTVTIPAESVLRWLRQINEEYDILSEAEKESDRHQADKIMSVWIR